MRYLIVDDDATFRERLVAALTRRGESAVGVGSAQEARKFAAAERPDRAIVDLRMPGPSGLDLIGWLRADHPGIDIVVLTGYGSIATTQEAMRRGALAYLTKPAHLDQILSAFSPTTPAASPLPHPTLEQVEWEHIQRILADCDWNVTHAARLLGIDRRSLQRRLAKAPVKLR